DLRPVLTVPHEGLPLEDHTVRTEPLRGPLVTAGRAAGVREELPRGAVLVSPLLDSELPATAAGPAVLGGGEARAGLTVRAAELLELLQRLDLLVQGLHPV